MRKYINLIILEGKRFFSRKNIFTIIICMIALIALHQYSYEKNYSNYLVDDRAAIDVFLEEYKVYAQDYTDRIRATEYDLESKTESNAVESEMDKQFAEFEMQRYQKVIDAWLECQQSMITGWYYEGKDPIEEDKAVNLYIKADRSLVPYEDIRDEIEDQGIYRTSHVDWEKRMAIHDAYEEAARQEPLCSYVPTGAYSVMSLFDGKGLVFFAVLCVIFFLNYDAWCKEFEDSSYVITFTLPYNRVQISLARWFARVILTDLTLLLFCAEIMGFGIYKHGSGLKDYVSVLRGGIYTAVTRAEYMKNLFIYLFFLCMFIVTFILLISVLLKDSVNALGIFFFFNCLYLLSSDFIHSKYNPIGLLKIGDIITQEGLLSIGSAEKLCLLYTQIELIVLTLVLIKRED